jgi:hypothetical protein
MFTPTIQCEHRLMLLQPLIWISITTTHACNRNIANSGLELWHAVYHLFYKMSQCLLLTEISIHIMRVVQNVISGERKRNVTYILKLLLNVVTAGIEERSFACLCQRNVPYVRSGMCCNAKYAR